MTEKSLDPRQSRFVAEYLKNGRNATQAAISAGYTARSAATQANRLLKKENIRQLLNSNIEKIQEQVQVTVGQVVREYCRIAFLDPRKLFDEKGRLRPIHELDADTAAAVAGFDFDELFERQPGQKRRHIGTMRKVKLNNKVAALEGLAKYLRMFMDVPKGEETFNLTINLGDGRTLEATTSGGKVIEHKTSTLEADALPVVDL